MTLAGTAATSVTAQRRNAVSALFAAGRTGSQIVSQLSEMGIVNPKTGKPFSPSTITSDLRQLNRQPNTPLPNSPRIVDGFKTFRRPMAETIGQWTYVKPQWNARILLNVDSTWQDYIFLDALRRGTAAGLEISGPALALPSAQKIASYVFGKGISASLRRSAIPASETKRTTLNEAAAVLHYPVGESNGKPTQNKLNALNQPTPPTNAAQPSMRANLSVMPKPKPDPMASDAIAFTDMQLQTFLESNEGLFYSIGVDDYSLGNVYVFVNPDCTLSIASPETVTVEYSASDYRRMLRVIVRTKMQNATVEDVYTATKRTITTEYYDSRGTVIEEYENLIGRIPMIHFANERSTNEIYGRPIYSGGLPILYRYNALIENILEGVTLLGTPIPMFTGLDNVQETKQNNATEITYTDEEGNQQSEWVTRLDRQTGLYIGKGGDGKMLSTNVGFTKDSLDMLRQLFLLWLSKTHIPEFIWGGAIASSKASADSQMPPFIQYINSRRLMMEGQGANATLGIEARGGLLELIDIWLRTYKLLNPSIIVGPVQIKWPEIDIANDQLKYMYLTYLNGTGKITDETTLRLSGYFDDPAAEVARATGQKTRPPNFENYEEKLRRARLAAAKAQQQPADDDGLPWSTDWVTPEIDILAGKGDQVYEHQHATGAALDGNPWNIAGPTWWLGMLNGREG